VHQAALTNVGLSAGEKREEKVNIDFWEEKENNNV